jgi:hypothetical protein
MLPVIIGIICDLEFAVLKSKFVSLFFNKADIVCKCCLFLSLFFTISKDFNAAAHIAGETAVV